MASRTGNYCAFYVSEPFSESGLGAHATKDFCYYKTLKMWKGKDNAFPFVDSHNKTYNVRDGSDWESTLKPRLRERLRGSANLVLFLSSDTVESKALKEEIDYGINTLGLPVIVVYPGFSEKSDIVENKAIKEQIKRLWNKVPSFRDNIDKIPTLHIPMKQTLIRSALKDSDFRVSTKKNSGKSFYPVK